MPNIYRVDLVHPVFLLFGKDKCAYVTNILGCQPVYAQSPLRNFCIFSLLTLEQVHLIK